MGHEALRSSGRTGEFYVLFFLFLRPSPGRGCGRPQPPLVRRMEWRPPLLCAYPFGHRVLATLKKCEKFKKRLVETHARCARGAQGGPRGASVSLKGAGFFVLA